MAARPVFIFRRLGARFIQIQHPDGDVEIVEIPTRRELAFLHLMCVEKVGYEQTAQRMNITRKSAEAIGAKVNAKLGERNIYLSGFKAALLGLLAVPDYQEEVQAS